MANYGHSYNWSSGNKIQGSESHCAPLPSGADVLPRYTAFICDEPNSGNVAQNARGTNSATGEWSYQSLQSGPPPPIPNQYQLMSCPPPFFSRPPSISSHAPPFSSHTPPFSSRPPSFSSRPPSFSSRPPPFTSRPPLPFLSHHRPTYCSPRSQSHQPQVPKFPSELSNEQSKIPNSTPEILFCKTRTPNPPSKLQYEHSHLQNSSFPPPWAAKSLRPAVQQQGSEYSLSEKKIRNFNLNSSSPIALLDELHKGVISFKKDQIMVNEWLEQIQKQNILTLNSEIINAKHDDPDATVLKGNEDKPRPAVKLHTVHAAVAQYQSLMTKIHETSSSQSSVSAAAALKAQLDCLSQQLNDSSYQMRVRRAVSQRRHKRHRQRAARVRRTDARRARAVHLKDGIRRAAEEQARVNRSAALRTEADAVLREVRVKQTEAEALSLLVSALRDLRQHRCNIGEQRGYVSSQGQDKHCEAVLVGLEEMVSKQSHVYQLEGRTLKAMLEMQKGNVQESDKEDQTSVPVTSDTQSDALAVSGVAGAASSCVSGAASAPNSCVSDPSSAPPNSCMSGAEGSLAASLLDSYTAADNSREILVTRRWGWDQYLSSDGTPVPTGGVHPPQHPTDQWLNFVQR